MTFEGKNPVHHVKSGLMEILLGFGLINFLGPVLQSIVSSTSSLLVKMLTVLVRYNI